MGEVKGLCGKVSFIGHSDAGNLEKSNKLVLLCVKMSDCGSLGGSTLPVASVYVVSPFVNYWPVIEYASPFRAS